MSAHPTGTGAVITATHVPGGYCGSTEYVIEGDFAAVTDAIAAIKGQYPPAGYGTWFNWPPPPDGPKVIGFGPNDKAAGTPITHLAPREIHPGHWQARGRHSNSCD